VGGTIVNGPKIQLAGFMNPPNKDPISVAEPPKSGPIIISASGAIITPREIIHETPTGIVKRIMAGTV